MKRVSLNETHKVLLEKVLYVSNSGVVNRITGRVYGSVGKNGYLDLSVKISDTLKVRAYAHRVVFLLLKGYLPDYIDHLDGNKLNNSISNLRDVDSSINGHNCKISKNNSSGTNGVYFDKGRGKWCAALKVDWRKEGFKRFDTKEEAIKHRLSLEEEFQDVIKKPQ